MITVGISESDAKIKQLALQFFRHHGIRCGTSLKQTDKDFLLCSAKSDTSYDILIENCSSNIRAYADYIHLLNSDDIVRSDNIKHPLIITYGLNRFATATASSIAADDTALHFLFCLQRNIISLKGKIIECQEFPVSLCGISDIHSAIAFTALAIISGISPNRLSKIVL